ncbi:MAG: fluoride efflux transporter CrcB [Planctomycetaceae bacterium]
MRALFMVGLGGCIGAVSRYAISEFVKQRVPAHPHAGTFVVNMLGCLVIGFVMNLAMEESATSQAWKLLIVTGCLGALTTFSTFGFETITLLQDRRLAAAVLNVVGNVAVGLPSVWVGMTLARTLTP